MTGVTELVLAVTMQQVAVTGVVRDSTDLEPVAYAQVTVEMSGVRLKETVTDRFGAFVLTGVDAGAGRGIISVDAFGYAPWRMAAAEVPDGDLTILLGPQPIALEEIRVNARRAADPLSSSPGAFVVDRELVRAQPVVLETDVLRATALSPAASPASDWVAAPFIRGGASEGTPIFLDGVRIFNPFHVGGFVAALNAEAISRVTLLTGSSSEALAVGSLSGAIDVATRDGARDRFRSSGSMGIASLRMSAEGPVGGSASFLVDARRSYIDLLTAGLGTVLGNDKVPYSFGDVHGKLTKDFGGVRRFSLTGYWNDEGLDSRPGDVPEGDAALRRVSRAVWGNMALAAHYRDRLGSATLVDLSVGHSRFSGDYTVFRGKAMDADTSSTVRGGMGEYRAEVRLRRQSGGLSLDGGVQATRFEAAHRAIGREWDGSDPWGLFQAFDISPSATRVAAFGGGKATLGGGFAAGGGVRADHYFGVGEALSPFAEVSYQRPGWKTWLSAGRTHQALSSIRSEEPVSSSFLAYDLLAPVEEGPLLRNSEVSAGWEGGARGVRLRVEAFARRMDNLRLPVLNNNPIESLMLVEPSGRELGSGTAVGLESTWSWSPAGGGATLVGSYRWAKVTRTVGGRTYTPRFHRDHEGELSASLRRGGSTWSVRFSARSGQPTTPIVAFLPFVAYMSPDAKVGGLYGDVLNFAGEYNSASACTLRSFPCFRSWAWSSGSRVRPGTPAMTHERGDSIMNRKPNVRTSAATRASAKRGVKALLRAAAPVSAILIAFIAGACDYTHPTEVFVPDEDVIAIAAVIGAGFDKATLLATWPHRDSSVDPPTVDARLSGPGWTATFLQDTGSHTERGLLACNLIMESVPWKGPASCLRARLPEPVEAGVRYTLSGTTEIGAFSGTTLVPPAPVLVEPAREFVATPAGDTFGVELRYENPAGAGLIVAEAANVVQVVVDGAGGASEEPRSIKFIVPRELNPAAESAHVTVWGYDSRFRSKWRPPEFRFDLHLVGFDENFSRFARLRYDRLVIRPWPSFGLSGDEGIYGYFGAASRSNPVRVIVRPR